MADDENSTKTARKKVPGRPYPKGVSGNPRGRPPTVKEYKELFLANGVPAAYACLLNEIKTRGPYRAKASDTVLAYGLGKPTQPVEHSGADGEPFRIIIQKIGMDE